MKTNKVPEVSTVLRIISKALLLLFVVNFIFILLVHVPIGEVSLYNSAFRGRERFPFGENPDESYNLSIYNLDGMFASHKLASTEKQADEYRVFVVGDSSVWGFLQKPEETLSGMLDSQEIACAGKQVRVYNLGYPSLSVLKDLLLIDRSKSYQPDLIIWMVTLESLPTDLQLETPLVANNEMAVNQLIEEYDLNLERLPVDYLDYTLVARRRELADLIRLQLYGLLWSATGIDQTYPVEFAPALRDFEEDDSFHDFEPSTLDVRKLSIDVIQKAIEKNKEIDFAVINEPILISGGKNSDIRYDYYYPRWAYDQYRVWMGSEMAASRIEYFDLWDITPQSNFTNSAIHLDRAGEGILVERISTIILDRCEP